MITIWLQSFIVHSYNVSRHSQKSRLWHGPLHEFIREASQLQRHVIPVVAWGCKADGTDAPLFLLWDRVVYMVPL